MLRKRTKLLTWIMSLAVLAWFLVTLFSEPDACTYDLDSNYYYEPRELEPELELKVRSPPQAYVENKLPHEDLPTNIRQEEENFAPPTKQIFSYNEKMPITFIGGIAGSGLELLRELLNQDSSKIRCGPETHLLTAIIEKNIEWLNIRMEKERLKHAGMDENIIDSAVAQFILQVLLRHEPITPHICNKDIYAFKWALYLKKLFPNAKFILVMRDPRAAVTSLTKRGFQYQGIRLDNYANALHDWNEVATTYYNRCIALAKSDGSCHLVLYEQLILKTNDTLNGIYKFLGIEAEARLFSFLEHRNGVDLVLKKVLLRRDMLFSWLNDFPKNLIYVADVFAPIMRTLGYDTSRIVPNNLVYMSTVQT